MRELDRFLSGFLEDRYGELKPAEKAAFETILDFPDPELYGYLLGRASPAEAEVAHLIERIRDHGSH